MNNALSVSVIICTHTDARWNYLLEAVASAQRQSYPPREIIVVIDHNPALLERVKQQLPAVNVVANDEPRGAAGSKNSGVKAAQGDIVAFLDDDAYAEPDWLERLVAELHDPRVLGVGGLTMPRWSGAEPQWMPEEFYWTIGCTHRGMPETTAPVRNLIACNMAVRREIFAFENFRNGMGPQGKHALGCEETEFCIRASLRRPEQIWLHQPSARAYHQVPASRATWSYFFRRCYGEGRSKALVTRFVGAQAGLASERNYTLRALPKGVVQGLLSSARGDMQGMARAAAIIGGLCVTTFGYVVGKLAEVPEQGSSSTSALVPAASQK